MKKFIVIILSIITITITSTTAFAAPIPRESAPLNATEAQIQITEVENGMDMNTAIKAAYEKIYQTADATFNYDEQFSLDTCYRDIPAVGMEMFTVARKLLLEAKK